MVEDDADNDARLALSASNGDDGERLEKAGNPPNTATVALKDGSVEVHEDLEQHSSEHGDTKEHTLRKIELVFYELGALIGRWGFCVLLVVLAVLAALTVALVSESSLDSDIFGSLVIRPASRLQRETTYKEKRFDDGWNGDSEPINAVATKGGKDVLSRSNLLQSIRFLKSKAILDVEIELGGVTYTAQNVLSLAGAQPFRYSILDCWQEGAYDYFGTVGELSASAGTLQGLIRAAMLPFEGEEEAVTITPYNYCLYARLARLYTPLSQLDPGRFGRCRQFVSDEDHSPALVAAYDFHRFYLFDLVMSSVALDVSPWACKEPFVSEPAGRCLSGMNGTSSDETCCELLKNDASFMESLTPNPFYTQGYAATPACARVFGGFYPVSDLYRFVVGTAEGAGPPERPTDYSECELRRGIFDSTPDQDVDALVEFGLERMLCELSGGCGSVLSSDAHFRFDANVASEAELRETALSGECAQWDGGPEGLGLFPYIPLYLTLGDQKDGGALGLQFVYASRGYKAMPLAEFASNSDRKQARQQWLIKFSDHVKGRHGSGGMTHGTYTSYDLEHALIQASTLDVWIVVLGYALVFFYAAVSMLTEVDRGESSSSSRGEYARAAMTHMLLGVTGVVLVVFGLVASMGAGSLAGIEFNPIMVAVLPLIVVGLGVNDVFLLAHAYCDVKRKDPNGSSKWVGQTLAIAGPSLTLTSTANFAAFMIARTLRIRIVANFATMAALGVLLSYLCVLVGFTAVLGLHTRSTEQGGKRKKKKQPGGTYRTSFTLKRKDDDDESKDDAHLMLGAGGGGSSSSSSPVVVVVEEEKRFYRDVLIPAYAALLTHPVAKRVIVVGGTIILTVLCAIGIPQLNYGMPLESLFKAGSSSYVFWAGKQWRFSDQFFFIDFAEADYAHRHPYIASVLDPTSYSVVQQMEKAKKTTSGQVMWFHVFINWALPCSAESFADGVDPQDARQACADSTLFGEEWLFNARCDPGDPLGAGNCGPKVSIASTLTPEESIYAAAYDGDESLAPGRGIPGCSALPVASFLCDGELCFEGYLDQETLANPKVVGIHPDYFYDCLDLFLNFDSSWTLYTPAFSCLRDPEEAGSGRTACTALPAGSRRVYRPSGDMDFSEMRAWATGVKSWSEWLQLVKSTRKHVNRVVKVTGIEAFPTGKLYKFYTQFKWLGKQLTVKLGLALVAVFGLATLLFALVMPAPKKDGHFTPKRVGVAAYSALIQCFVVGFTVLTLMSVMGLFGLILNCFTAVTIIAAVGISLEFTAHFIHFFLTQTGSRVQRTAATLNLVLPPVVDGSVTTLLGILPLAASQYEYFFDYYFLLYIIIIALGVGVGLVLTPALLATIGIVAGDPGDGEDPGGKLLPQDDDDGGGGEKKYGASPAAIRLHDSGGG